MTDFGNDDSTAHVIETETSEYSVNIKVSGHKLVGDEPVSFGSKNLGPNPYDFLLASLGSCTAMTVRWYAKQKDWPLENVEVNLKHEKIHAEDCNECESQKGKVDIISKEVIIHGDELSDEQKEKLVEIANKCPVQKTITSEVLIKKI